MPCEYNGTQNSIEWFCSLNEVLRASATLPSSGTVYSEIQLASYSMGKYIKASIFIPQKIKILRLYKLQESFLH